MKIAITLRVKTLTNCSFNFTRNCV